MRAPILAQHVLVWSSIFVRWPMLVIFSGPVEALWASRASRALGGRVAGSYGCRNKASDGSEPPRACFYDHDHLGPCRGPAGIEPVFSGPSNSHFGGFGRLLATVVEPSWWLRGLSIAKSCCAKVHLQTRPTWKVCAGPPKTPEGMDDGPLRPNLDGQRRGGQ